MVTPQWSSLSGHPKVVTKKDSEYKEKENFNLEDLILKPSMCQRASPLVIVFLFISLICERGTGAGGGISICKSLITKLSVSTYYDSIGLITWSWWSFPPYWENKERESEMGG